MRSPTPLIILIVAALAWSCGKDPATPSGPPVGGPSRAESGRDAPPTEDEEEEEAERPAREAGPLKKFGFQSPYRNAESLLKPLDGFPLPATARLERQGRDLVVYEVRSDLATVEAFYDERGFRITRPGKLPGIIVTRTDTGTRLQVKPGKHRGTVLRFYR